MRVPIDLVGQAYNDNTKPISVQECINWHAEIVETEGARTKIAMKGSPGSVIFSSIGEEPIRGVRQTAEILYVVSGGSLYSINSVGTATSLGSIAGQNRVDISDNRVSGGNEIVIVNGAQGYVYNTATSTFTQITDPDFFAADVVDFLDQYLIFNRSGTAQFFLSDLSNALSYNALQIATKEAQTDNLVTLKVNNGLLFLFGKRSTEVWENAGLPDFPLQRINGATFGVGCASKFGRITLNDRLFFLGHDGKAYMMNGYVPQRISTHAMEQAFADEDISTCFMFSRSKRGHDFVYYAFPAGKTWVFDLAGGWWHRVKSYDIEGWGFNSYASVYGKDLVGDYTTGKIWELREDIFTERGNPLVAERITQYAHADQKALLFNELELVFDTGHGTVSGQGSDPQVEFRFSDDFGRNYTNFRQVSLGQTGEYGKRIRFQRMGRSYNRVAHIRVSDPVKRDLIASTIDITVLQR